MGGTAEEGRPVRRLLQNPEREVGMAWEGTVALKKSEADRLEIHLRGKLGERPDVER